MKTPTVSFIVPCYNLAHLLRDCMHSILAQSYDDFEILVMDDQSPDDTPQVASSFRDSRIRHIRNEENLGHLRNYNKGISMSGGKYIWLISADDRLRKPYLLERYVRVMENNPGVGFACCPAMRLESGLETKLEGLLVTRDTIFGGKQFLKTLLKGNCIMAASGMVRKVCYETCGTFPLDLPYAGDWFMWCLFALRYQIAYFAEPMVNYRAHDLSMTNYLMQHRAALALKEGFAVLWRVRNQAREAGATDIVRLCGASLAGLYARHLIGGEWEHCMYSMTEEELDADLVQECTVRAERDWIRARVWMNVGDMSLKLHDLIGAMACYKRALRYDRALATVWGKLFLLSTGGRGVGVARGLWKLKQNAFR